MFKVSFKLPGGVKRFEISAGLRFTHDRSILKRKMRIYIGTRTADQRWECQAAGVCIQERPGVPWLSCNVFHECSDEISMNSRFAHLLGGRCTDLIAELLELVEAVQKALRTLPR